MRLTKHILAIAATTLLATSVSAIAEEWHEEKDQDGIQVYTRAVEGWSMREMRGVATISARLSSLVAVIDDVPSLPKLNDSVATAEVKNRVSDTRYQIYSTMRVPWPLSNRDVLTQREITQDKTTLTVTITEAATQDVMPEREGYVRISRSQQKWILVPTPGGPVEVEVRTLSDPAGPIPSSLVNAASVSIPFKMIQKLRELAQQSRYVRATMPFIQEPAHPREAG
jgi:hypothetical protein